MFRAHCFVLHRGIQGWRGRGIGVLLVRDLLSFVIWNGAERTVVTDTLAVLAVYKRHASETISVVPFLLGRPLVYTSSLEVARQILDSSLFDKAPETSSALSWVFQCCQQISIELLFFFYFCNSAWGDNVISIDNERHKRHRRIVGPAFAGGMFVFCAFFLFQSGDRKSVV